MSEISEMSNKCEVDTLELLDQQMDKFRRTIKERKIKSVATSNTPFYKKAITPTLKHSKVPEYVYSRIKKVDFRNEAGLTEENQKLTLRHFLFICTEKIIDIMDQNGLGICYRDGQVYLFNGEYWRVFPLAAFQSFMGESAIKMGVNKFIGGIYSFKEQLAKQFMSVAYMIYDNDSDFDDYNKAMINLKNGTFEMGSKGLKLRKPNKDDFLTYQLNFEYDENAECPLFNKFLDRVLPDKTLQMILAEYIGYLFIKTEDLKLEKVLLLYGTGANGKSVFFEIVYALLGGKSNVSNFSLENLTRPNGYARAMLGGKLLNYSTEINGKLNESVFKQLVSGEPVDARLPYGDPFTLTNYGKMIFNCNALPRTTDYSDAFYRRFLIIPFNEKIPRHEQDKQLARKIINRELPGVFNWVLKGFKRLIIQKEFTDSYKVDAIINDYRGDGDTVALFIDEEKYLISYKNCITIGDLYEQYGAFCENKNCTSVSKRDFTNRLRNRGINLVRKNYGLVAFLSK